MSSFKVQQQRAQQLSQTKQIYIYAEVDIDKGYSQILQKSKKIKNYLAEKNLNIDFIEKMRKYKNFRICFDNEIQKFIHKKQVSADLRLIKKHVFTALEDFIISRYDLYLEEQALHQQYKEKLAQIESKFSSRFQDLMKHTQ